MSRAATPDELDLRRSYSQELSALAALFWLTLRQHTHGRRLLVLGLLYALPCILVVVIRALARTAPREMPDILEFAFVFMLLPHALAPLTALLYAAGVIPDEVEEQTLTYLLLRSVPRWSLYVTKLLATLCVTVLLVASAVFVLEAAIWWGSPDFWGTIMPGRAARAAGIMALAQVGYCALFGALGVYTKRSLLAGIAYIVAIEGVLANIEFVLRKLTVVYYVRTLTLRWLEFSQETLGHYREAWGISDMEKIPTAGDCVQTLVVFGVVVTALTAWWFARSEFRVKTPEGS